MAVTSQQQVLFPEARDHVHTDTQTSELLDNVAVGFTIFLAPLVAQQFLVEHRRDPDLVDAIQESSSLGAGAGADDVPLAPQHQSSKVVDAIVII